MASIADYLRQFGGQMNQGLQGLRPALEQGFANPLTHAGLGIMMGSQQGGPGAAAGFMQGMHGYNQFAGQQAQIEDQKAMRQLQAAQLARMGKQDEREDTSRKVLMDALRNNPQMLADNPLARTVLESTGDPSQLQGLGGLMPRAPTPMGEYQAGLLDLQRQRLGLDQMRYGDTADIQRQRVEMEGKRAGLDERRLDLDARRVGSMEAAEQRAASTAQRQAMADQQKKLISANALDAKYKGAIAELDNYDKRLKEFAEMPGFSTAFGAAGMLAEKYPTATGMISPETNNAIARRKELQAQGMLSALLELSGAGVSLAPISNADAEALKAKAGNLEAAQTPAAAKRATDEMRAQLDATKRRIAEAYQADRALYEVQGGADESRDFQDAQRALQARPDMRDEINRRLMQKYGRGL